MNSNLDVWAIQYAPKELKNALSGLSNEGLNILYTNAFCKFNIGDVNITSRQFDTFLYSEASDRLVMLMRNGEATALAMKSELDNQGIIYHEVSLLPLTKKQNPSDNIPELWLAREAYVLEDAIKDTLAKGWSSCWYFPNLEGKLELGYVSAAGHVNPIEGRLFKGFLQFGDKIVLIVSQHDERNLDQADIEVILNKYSINASLYATGCPEFILEEKRGRV